MTKIIDINRHLKPKLRIVKNSNKELNQLEVAMNSAAHSLRASRTWSEHKLAHLLNCRDALDRVSFYLDDEISEELSRERDDEE